LTAREIAVDRALDDAVSTERATVGETATSSAFVKAVRRGDVEWLRQQLATLPEVVGGGSAQLWSSKGRLIASAGPVGIDDRLLLAGGIARRDSPYQLSGAPGGGYETHGGRLSIFATQPMMASSASEDPYAGFEVWRPVDKRMLDTIGSYAGVRLTTAPPDIVGKLRLQSGGGVPNQYGATFIRGSYRDAYLGMYDGLHFSGAVMLSMERTTASGAMAEIRSMAIAALLVALAAATVAALLVSRRISRPLLELTAAAAGIAGGQTRQEIHVGGGDEVGQLASAFNTMSERVTERVTDLSDKITSLTDELIDLNVVFGETLTDTVDVESELPHMVPRIGSMMKADLACLYLFEEFALGLAFGDAGSHAAALEAAAKKAVVSGSAVAIPEGEGEGATDGASTHRTWPCSRRWPASSPWPPRTRPPSSVSRRATSPP
jgi:HAMP domain-containing protein